MHDVLSGKAVTGVCTFYQKTPVDWFCKQQSTSETATYGAEFLSGRKSVKRSLIIEHTSNIWANQYMTWTMYGETTRV